MAEKCTIIDCEQGSNAWHQARLGVITASKIGAVITATGKPTANAARRRYALDLVAERLTKRPTETYCTAAMQRGKDLEPLARAWYFTQTRKPVNEVGFCLAAGLLSGASPDGLVGDDGGVEIKCPEMAHYLDIIESGVIDAPWVLQCHHAMYVTGRKWWDFVLFTDVQPFTGWIKRIERDPVMCGKIHEAIRQFSEEVYDIEMKVKERAGITDGMMRFDPPVMIGDNEISMEGVEL
jgi:putative phage-type endonuclease